MPFDNPRWSIASLSITGITALAGTRCNTPGRAVSQAERGRCLVGEGPRAEASSLKGESMFPNPVPLVDAKTRSSRARVPLTAPPGWFGRIAKVYSRRMYGDVLDTGLAMAHHRPVLFADVLFERRVARWKRLDPTLKTLAVMVAATRIECSWCVDFGYFAASGEGIDLDKVAAVGQWRNSTLFTDLERRVLEYAEAMTSTPPVVSDELAASLKSALGVDALVELTMMVAVENQRSRFNAALGLTSQGFSESCRAPQRP